MTINTALFATQIGMIKFGVVPVGSVMAIVTDIILSANVRTRFATRCCAIVAGGAGLGHVGMVKPSRKPGIVTMACVTLIATGRVFDRFTGGDAAIMTANTSAAHLCVLHGHGFPIRFFVACAASV